MRFLACWIMVFALLLAVGCKSAQPSVADANAPDGEGYYTLMQRTSGGNALENSNAKSLTVTHENGVTVIRIAFVLGSKLSNVDEAVAASLPAYELFGFAEPARLVLDIDNLAYWDYDRKVDIPPDDPMLFGIYKQALTDVSHFRIYFQIKKNVMFKVQESGDTLIITLKEAEAQESEEKFFITANLSQPLSEAQLGNNIDLYLTLCDDLSHTLLISQPFDTREEADAYRQIILDRANGILPEKQVAVIPLAPYTLPSYNMDLVYQSVYSLTVMREGGMEKQLPVVMPDGIYLCMTKDGRRMLFSKQLATPEDSKPAETPMPSGDATDVAVDESAYADAEQLWIVEANGRKKQLTDFEFSSIAQAKFSPNGKLLAILESGQDASYLHIFDMETSQLLYNLGEGFGDSISTFIWDSMGTAIYAVGGTDKMRLLKYDFTIPDEAMRVSMVEDSDIEAGDLGFLGGELYFTDNVEGAAGVYRIKPEGGVRALLTAGSSFSISPDGKFMCVQEVTSIGGEGEETTNNASMKIVDLATKKETSVLKDANIVSMGWGYQNKLYFTVGDLEQAGDERFLYTLMEYDLESGETREIADIITADISPSLIASEILLPCLDSSGAEYIRATYLLSVE